MDTSAVLESIAKTLPVLPPEAVENSLVTFDVLVGVADAAQHPAAAQLLRDAAQLSDETRKQRLLAAASSVEAGEPCATTPDGLTWRQAAAAQTITLDASQVEHWQDFVQFPEPPQSEEQPDSDEPIEPLEIMEREPPKLPRLRVRQFFPGLVVRVRREIQDVYGTVFVAGHVLHLESCQSSGAEGGQTILELPDRTLYLDASMPDCAAILANNGNAWFQPVPSASCLESLCEEIDRLLTQFEEAASDDEDEDEDEDAANPERAMLAAIRQDLERCQDWLSSSVKRGGRPRCDSGPLAAQVFGRNHLLAAWVPLLFAAIEYCGS